MTTEADVYNALRYCRVVTNSDGSRMYFDSDNLLHRDDGPAALWADGTEIWYQHGLRHRVGGPAITWPNGSPSWYLFGVWYTPGNYCKQLELYGLQ